MVHLDQIPLQKKNQRSLAAKSATFSVVLNILQLQFIRKMATLLHCHY